MVQFKTRIDKQNSDPEQRKQLTQEDVYLKNRANYGVFIIIQQKKNPEINQGFIYFYLFIPLIFSFIIVKIVVVFSSGFTTFFCFSSSSIFFRLSRLVSCCFL